MQRKVLLGSGIASSALYIASDIIGSLRYPGYRYADQEFSELTAAGAPTRPLMIALNEIPYTALVTAFAAGVGTSPRRSRIARRTGAWLTGYALTGMAGGTLFPMTPRGTSGARRNLMHPPATAVMSLCLMLGMGSGAGLFGSRFRAYTYGTIATLVLFGALASLQVGGMVRGEPTPWMGLEERINIYASMLWLAALAGGLLRAEEAA